MKNGSFSLILLGAETQLEYLWLDRSFTFRSEFTVTVYFKIATGVVDLSTILDAPTQVNKLS